MRGGGKPAQLKEAELEALWEELADDDAAKAYRAIWRVADSPQAVAYLKAKLKPIRDLDEAGRKRLEQLIRDLDSKQFAQRQKATNELEKLGELALPDLKKALAGKPSLETKRRLEELVAKFGGKVPDRETLRALRAVEALEYAATAEALRQLEALAGGAAGARLTQDARGAVERLKRRAKAP